MNNVVGILDAIGNTPLVELRQVVPTDAARVLLKLEGHNPTGSMKDRMAIAVVRGAIESGRLSSSGSVVEYTGGSTGTSLAFVCAALGIPITLVSSDAFSQEKRDQMRSFGGTVIEVPSEEGRTTKKLIEQMIAKAEELSAKSGVFYSDQFNNPDAAGGYTGLADEIWTQTGGVIDSFVQSVGTAQCIKGVSAALRKYNPHLRVCAVEPSESAVLSGDAAGSHKIEGVGPGFVPPIWSSEFVEEVQTVSTDDAKNMTRKIAREEALFCGTSSGANVVAAIRVAEKLGPGKTVVTVACDTGLKYLSTDLFSV